MGQGLFAETDFVMAPAALTRRLTIRKTSPPCSSGARRADARATAGLDEPADQVLVRLRLFRFFAEPVCELTRRAATTARRHRRGRRPVEVQPGSVRHGHVVADPQLADGRAPRNISSVPPIPAGLLEDPPQRADADRFAGMHHGRLVRRSRRAEGPTGATTRGFGRD